MNEQEIYCGKHLKFGTDDRQIPNSMIQIRSFMGHIKNTVD